MGIGLVFAVTVFLGAFLLFQVQPLIGRFLVPWFGGSPEVWTTCMLFFQVFLLGGYAYAHGLSQMKSIKAQCVIHLLLLAAAFAFLPILPSEVFKPTGADNPISRILLICTMTVGLPYFLLSATSPLIQLWFSKVFPTRNPYRLYALSNAGSLLALASFPFVFEPMMSRNKMAYLWSIIFGVFAILFIASIRLYGKRSTANPIDTDSDTLTEDTKPSWLITFLWLALPAAASVELLAVTAKITQDIAVIPFLWVLPLSLYLLSFIICFEHPRWYKRWLFVPLFMLGIGGMSYMLLKARDEYSMMDVRHQIGLYVFMLFSCCMVCHGELYRLRPQPKRLTAYYLTISAGGAAGGVFVVLIAPLIFDTYIELHLGILASVMFVLCADQATAAKRHRRSFFWIAALCVVGLLGILSIGKRSDETSRPIANSRNFFGVLTIWEENWNDPGNHRVLMQHGTTFHGLQYIAPELKRIPTAYYSPDSGIGLIMQNWPQTTNRRVGIIGLGVGTIAIYGDETDTINFYEINPEVDRLAREHFMYLDDSAATVEVLLGDGRLVMENEPPQNYDVLVLDAFSSDAVPVHLLTTEAMEIYLKHLAADGVMAFHISTVHLDLQSIVWKLAEHFKLETAWIQSAEDTTPGALASDWILLARNDSFLGTDAIQENNSRPRFDPDTTPLWTDDHINLLKIIKKSRF